MDKSAGKSRFRWFITAYKSAREAEWLISLFGFLGIGGKAVSIVTGLSTGVIALLTGVGVAPTIALSLVVVAATMFASAASRARKHDAPIFPPGSMVTVVGDDGYGVSVPIGVPKEAQTPNHVEYFPDRDALNKAYPIKEQFARGNDIYAFWVAGRGMLEYHAEHLQNDVLRELILPHPETHALKTLASSIDKTADIYDLAEHIKTNTRVFQREFGTAVYWFREFLGIGGHIGNPGRDDAWAVLEFTLPFVAPTKRQSILIRGKEAVEVWWDWYKKLRNNSELQPKPTPSTPDTEAHPEHGEVPKALRTPIQGTPEQKVQTLLQLSARLKKRMNETVKSDEDLQRLKSETDSIRAAVGLLLTPVEQNRLSLVPYQKRRYERQFNDEHGSIWQGLMAYINVLDTIIERNADRLTR